MWPGDCKPSHGPVEAPPSGASAFSDPEIFWTLRFRGISFIGLGGVLSAAGKAASKRRCVSSGLELLI
jgi:hypothetical protein